MSEFVYCTNESQWCLVLLHPRIRQLFLILSLTNVYSLLASKQGCEFWVLCAELCIQLLYIDDPAYPQHQYCSASSCHVWV